MPTIPAAKRQAAIDAISRAIYTTYINDVIGELESVLYGVKFDDLSSGGRRVYDKMAEAALDAAEGMEKHFNLEQELDDL